MRTALVLSAGGMFGAWQVGAWRVLEKHVEPDLVVGASIGSLNGWAIAGGSSAAELAEHWLTLGDAMRLRPRLPRSLTGGWLDGRRMERVVRELHARFEPRTKYALAMTDMLRLRPVVVEGGEVTAEHLLASCAVPVLFDAQRIGGRLYTDGGLLNALPEWIAFRMGAEQVISLNAMPYMPSAVARTVSRTIRRISRFRAEAAAPGRAGNVVRIRPETALGGPVRMMSWDAGRIREWLERGSEDAEAALERSGTFQRQMF